jgi:hypothetical protein
MFALIAFSASNKGSVCCRYLYQIGHTHTPPVFINALLHVSALIASHHKAFYKQWYRKNSMYMKKEISLTLKSIICVQNRVNVYEIRRIVSR